MVYIRTMGVFSEELVTGVTSLKTVRKGESSEVAGRGGSRFSAHNRTVPMLCTAATAARAARRGRTVSYVTSNCLLLC